MMIIGSPSGTLYGQTYVSALLFAPIIATKDGWILNEGKKANTSDCPDSLQGREEGKCVYMKKGNLIHLEKGQTHRFARTSMRGSRKIHIIGKLDR